MSEMIELAYKELKMVVVNMCTILKLNINMIKNANINRETKTIKNKITILKLQTKILY